MIFVLLIVLILMLYILYQPLHQAYIVMRKQSDQRQILFADDSLKEAMRRRRYAPLHTLPTVKWQNVYTDTAGGACFAVPVLVTVNDTGTFDCSSICDNETAVYFFVNSSDNYIVNGTRLIRGGYCTLNSIPRNCNSETSLILYSVNQWTCIAEDPRYYAGESNIVQIAGRQHSDQILAVDIDKIVLWDNMLQRSVNPFVNTHRHNWDEKIAGSDVRRFSVQCNALDIRHNQMFINPYNALECLPNVCTSARGVHRDVKPDFVRGVCDCGDFDITRVRHIDENAPSSRCASIVNRLIKENRDYQFRVECLSLDTPITDYSPTKPLCPPEIFNQNTDFAYTFTLQGVVPLSGNGIDEPTHGLWRDTRSRIVWNDVHS
ncbi:ORF_39 [Adoxophyes orana granulovirus]|uniref:ORF_39 n=1 Tax=Adoxophyes orana granulovirus TaxID=170617 RepID=Q7T9X6_GVAO|nr:ORF_39 [Adoxophyes orana granulovirus]AAP85676.1 ORF_39 [Adoxophyes orana granulovirus]